MATNEELVLSDKFETMLESRGVTRRQFLAFCGTIAAAIGLSELHAPQIAHALEIGATSGSLKPVIWLEAASCTGCTESLAQASYPDVASIVLELISLNYSETLSAGAGHSLEQAKTDTINAGGYLLVYEGALVRGWEGNALRIAEETGEEILEKAAANAEAVIAAGTCAVDGGWVAAYPNPANACGVQSFLKEKGIETPVINLPACPVNPEWIVAVLVDYLLLDTLPELDSYNRPTLMFGSTIHDNCPRRGHFDNGEFVYKFGSEEEKKGYCLYAMGCKGPQTYSDCPTVRWNRKQSWCIEVGAPCIGCASCNPLKEGNNWYDTNAPFMKRHRVLKIGSLVTSPQTIGLVVTGVVAGCIVIHGFGMKIAGRLGQGAPYEEHRKWDVKHPDKAIEKKGEDE